MNNKMKPYITVIEQQLLHSKNNSITKNFLICCEGRFILGIKFSSCEKKGLMVAGCRLAPGSFYVTTNRTNIYTTTML
jgi:hypothetical protein